MFERDKHEANREALAGSKVHNGRSAQRYEAAFRRYLAAIAYHDERSAHAAQRQPAAPADADLSAVSQGDEVRWDLDTAVVKDVMTRDVISIDESATFRHIVDTLTSRRISAVPVVDADRRLVGIVSESDLLAKVVTAGDPHARIAGPWRMRSVTRRKSNADTASGLMTSPVVTTTPYTSVVQAARVSAAELVRRMPVVDESGRLVGIVTRSDLLSVFDRSDDDIRTHIIEDLLRGRFCVNPQSVEVKVEQGVVTLYGEVETESLVRLVVNAARSTLGVVSVHNRLGYRVADQSSPPVTGPMY
jgi:CBS-domain-containing membrane protein